MPLKLSDLQAPAWVWRVGEAAWPMRPLSLATFAEAELMGCGLDQLLDQHDKAGAFEAWVLLYAFLAQRPPESVLPEIAAGPDMFTAFVSQVQGSFTPPDAEEEKAQTHRRSKDPRERIGIDRDGQPKTGGGTDYAVLFDLARYAKIPLSDLYQMTFRGLIALTQHLESNPPAPSMFGE